MISKNPKEHFIAALLDIDDFKFINDIYGHVYGDNELITRGPWIAIGKAIRF